METLHPTRAGNNCVTCGTCTKRKTVNQVLVTVTFSTEGNVLLHGGADTEDQAHFIEGSAET